jgi:NAD(P)-dependent dehydrogenase (short-subunit alcohol dehydrogenase family)
MVDPPAKGPAGAVVTGASRGIGRAIAISLGELGFTVYVTGRTRHPGPVPGTIDRTADEVTAAGGTGVAVACDHHDDDAVGALFARVAGDGVPLRVLVNNVFPTDAVAELGDRPFFEQPVGAVDEMLAVGLRTHYVATWHAVPLLQAGGGGLVVNISSAGAAYSVLSPAYCMAKAGLDKFTVDAALQLKPSGIAVVSVWPGPLVGTERVEAETPERVGEVTESPFVTGRAVAALAGDDGVLRLTGRVLVAADVAAAYGVVDVDGATPAFPFDQDQIRRQLLRRSPLRLAE